VRRRNGVVPTNAHLFFAIYQAIAEREDIGGYYKEYPEDFFDLIVIDECHRGAANEEGSWRAILDHFKPAVHLGLTATPKRSDNIDTYNYFGKPVYEYALKDGINDGFLTPYRVKRVRTNLDELILTDGDLILKGESKKDLYESTDYDQAIIAEERTELVAKAILENNNPLDKTIVFCVNQNHALTMRDMLNKHKTVKDPLYCVRVTSDEGKDGRELLEQFQDNDKNIPTILTSSQMLTTGVDARNVRNIVLDRNIGSMVEFKQIVGRGTRIFEGKDYFTIIDFRGATNLFYDPEWDGTIDEPEPDEVGDPPGGGGGGPGPGPGPEPPEETLTVQLSPTRQLKVIDVDTRYIDENGRPLTAQQFLERLMLKLPDLFSTVDDLRERWANPDGRELLLKELGEAGFDSEQLQTLRTMFEAEACDLFDLLAFLTHETPMHTRRERAEKTREASELFARYPDPSAQAFLDFILEKYEQTGTVELSRKSLARLVQLSGRGTIGQLSHAFGGSAEDLQHELYYCV